MKSAAEPSDSAALGEGEPLAAETPGGEARGPTRARRMLDRYEILAEIARGGMGTVYLARLGGAGGFERLFAIKLMHEHLAEDDAFVTMLLDEARTAAHIHHPNAVGIIDVRESPVGYYLVMNYVDGFALSQILDHPGLDRATCIRISTRLLADAAHGLHAAHTAKSPQGQRLGIVHRDVSPQNILVGTDGTGRIVDFGIALAASRVTASRPGMLKGKPSYMAPEQARGDACDARSDVFALGIMLWEVLTGERLFYSDMDLATLVKVMECVVEPPTKHAPGLHEALSAVTMKALQRDPADRYATARDFAVAVERAAERAGVLATAQEVEEVLARLFADEMATRQEAVRARLADAPGKEQPLDRVGLAGISRLVPRARRDDGTESSAAISYAGAPDQPATRASRPGAEQRSGVRESATPRTPVVLEPQIDPHAGTRISEKPAAPAENEQTAPSAESAKPAPPRASRAPIVVAIVIAVVALGGAAAMMVGGGSEPIETPRERVAAPPIVGPPIVAPPTTEPPTLEPPPAARAEPEVIAPAVPLGLDAPSPEVAPVEVAPVIAPRAPRTRREPAEERPARTPRAPVVETNPYLTH